MTFQAFWSIFNLNMKRQPTLTDNVSLVFKTLLYDTNRQQLQSNISLNQVSQNKFVTRCNWDELETPVPWRFHMHAAYVTRPQSNHSLCGVTPLQNVINSQDFHQENPTESIIGTTTVSKILDGMLFSHRLRAFVLSFVKKNAALARSLSVINPSSQARSLLSLLCSFPPTCVLKIDMYCAWWVINISACEEHFSSLYTPGWRTHAHTPTQVCALLAKFFHFPFQIIS